MRCSAVALLDEVFWLYDPSEAIFAEARKMALGKANNVNQAATLYGIVGAFAALGQCLDETLRASIGKTMNSRRRAGEATGTTQDDLSVSLEKRIDEASALQNEGNRKAALDSFAQQLAQQGRFTARPCPWAWFTHLCSTSHAGRRSLEG